MDKKITIYENIQIEESRFNKIMPDTKNRDLKFDIIWNNISRAENTLFNKSAHIHSFYEVYCVLDGTTKIEIKNIEITLEKDDCILIPPNFEHRVKNISNDFTRYDVAFRITSETFTKNISITPNNDSIVFKMTNEMKNQLSYMMKYSMANNPYSSTAIGNALNAFIIDVLSHVYLSNIDEDKKKTTYQMSLGFAAKEFIQDNYERQITPEDVADELHISVRQLSRILKKFHYMNFSTLLENVRIEKAKKYLETTSMSVEEIAYLSGYTNHYTFIRAFKRVVGVTPRKYNYN